MRSDALGLFWRDEPVIKVKKEAVPKRSPPAPTWLRADYLPRFEEARAFNIPQFTDSELLEAGRNHERVVFDIECYPNYFLIAFRSIVSGKITYIEMRNDESLDSIKLRWILEHLCIVGFNSMSYDIPLAQIAVSGRNCADLVQASEQIISYGIRGSDVMRQMKVRKIKAIDHIDLIEVAPLDASLKIYSGRLHAPRMQDLPFPPETRLSDDQITIVRWYCVNDLINTELLYNGLQEQLTLRETMSKTYGMDLRSKSDAQIAEVVIGREIEKLNGYRAQRPSIEVGTSYRYNVPPFIKYHSPLMQGCLDIVRGTEFVIGNSGKIDKPPVLENFEIKIANGVYRVGIGGLHSSEKCISHCEDEDTVIVDHDVSSNYPRIILNQGLFPSQLGRNFIRVYDSIVERRLAAKRSGDRVTAESLKIMINGSFGKFGNIYSILYSPELLIQVTITGQLSLLMLIERLELCGYSVISANTDGLIIKCLKSCLPEVDRIIKQWEYDTGFETEKTPYRAVYSRDVNNYIAVKPDGKIKAKGVYSWHERAVDRLHKNPANEISVLAVLNYLTSKTPIGETVRGCTDIRKFLTVRTVKGGAVKVWGDGSEEGNEYLGKAVRWYYATGETGEMVYALSGNKVPRSDGAKPLMDLPECLPDDLNHDWYEQEAASMLAEIGCHVSQNNC